DDRVDSVTVGEAALEDEHVDANDVVRRAGGQDVSREVLSLVRGKGNERGAEGCLRLGARRPAEGRSEQHEHADRQQGRGTDSPFESTGISTRHCFSPPPLTNVNDVNERW